MGRRVSAYTEKISVNVAPLAYLVIAALCFYSVVQLFNDNSWHDQDAVLAIVTSSVVATLSFLTGIYTFFCVPVGGYRRLRYRRAVVWESVEKVGMEQH
jgi:hypothetical protein